MVDVCKSYQGVDTLIGKGVIEEITYQVGDNGVSSPTRGQKIRGQPGTNAAPAKPTAKGLGVPTFCVRLEGSAGKDVKTIRKNSCSLPILQTVS